MITRTCDRTYDSIVVSYGTAAKSLTKALKANQVAGLREFIIIDGKNSSETRAFADHER